MSGAYRVVTRQITLYVATTSSRSSASCTGRLDCLGTLRRGSGRGNLGRGKRRDWVSQLSLNCGSGGGGLS